MQVLRSVAASAALAAGLCATPRHADAGVWFFSRSGEVGYFAAGVHGYPPRDIGRSGWAPVERRVPVWRETSRYEYRPATVVRHGAHYEAIPERYRFESDGYWDWE